MGAVLSLRRRPARSLAMTEHVHMRVRTASGAYGLVSPTEGDAYEIEIAVEGYRRPPTPEEREEVLELINIEASKIRSQAYKMLGRKPRRKS